MSRPRLCIAGAIAGLLLVPLLTPAKPLLRPKSDGLPALERYLIDDADFLLTVDVKQVINAPAFARRFQPQLQTLLAHDAVAGHIKDAGLNPLKDVDRITFQMGKSSFNEDGNSRNDDGPVILIQGRFDPARLHKTMAALAKEHPTVVTTLEAGKHKFYHVKMGGDGPYVAVLDRSTVLVCGRKMHVTGLLAQATGTKKAEPRHKEMAAALKSFKTDFVVQGVALPSMVIESSVTFKKDAGGGRGPIERRHVTLSDKGFSRMTIQAKLVKDAIRGEVRLAVADKLRADAFLKGFNEGLDFVKKMVKTSAPQEPKLAVVGRALDGLRVSSKADSITFAGEMDADMIAAMVEMMGIAPAAKRP